MTYRSIVIQTVPDLNLKSGGPSRSVAELSYFLNRTHEVKTKIVTQCGFQHKPHLDPNNCAIFAEGHEFMLKLGLPFKRQLLLEFTHGKPSLIHDHGVWHAANHWSSSIARSQNIPCIVQPHGMLEPWALNYRRFKKQLAMSLYQRKHLESAVAFVASSEMEYRSIRNLKLRQPIAIIPNGITGFDTSSDVAKAQGARVRNFLFLSRIHPKKGLINLLQAWAAIDTQDWMLNIAGPSERNHLTEVKAEIIRLGIGDRVIYLGELYGKEKEAAYVNADIFVLPTFSENFGIVVAEALAHRIPVITTKGTPWSDLETFKAGWWIELGAEPLKLALQEAISLSDQARRAMGERGLELVQRFNWPTIADLMIEFYKWVTCGGQRPSHVFID